jgi:hypothetical protein
MILPKLYRRTKTGIEECEIRVVTHVDRTVRIHTVIRWPGKRRETTALVRKGDVLQAEEQAKQRWLKQIKAGYVDSLALLPRRDHVKAMRPCQDYTTAKKIDWGTAFVQPYVGMRRILFHRHFDGSVIVTNADGTSRVGMVAVTDSIAAAMQRALTKDDPADLVLDAEFTTRAGDRGVQQRIQLLDCAHADADFTIRHAILTRIGLALPATITVAETIKVRDADELMFCQREFIRRGFPSALLRYGRQPYEVGKLSHTLVHVQTFAQAPFKIVDYRSRPEPAIICETEENHVFTAPLTLACAATTVLSKCVGRTANVQFQKMSRDLEPVPLYPIVCSVS